jgi:hypothetical protein
MEAWRRATAAAAVARSSYMFKRINLRYSLPMRHFAPAAAILVALLLLMAPAGALAEGPPTPLPGNGVSDGNGHTFGPGHDPCRKRRGAIPPFCQQAPEAPYGLLYPGAAVLSIVVFWSLERRRRQRGPRVG